MARSTVGMTCIGICVLILAASASAQPKWGTQAFGSVGDIRSGGGQNNHTNSVDGGAGVWISEVIIDDSVTPDFEGTGPWDRGNTHAFTGLAFGANTPPALKSEAILTGNRSPHFRFGELPAGAVAWAGAFASDLFQYTGSAPATLSWTVQLEGVLNDPPGGNANADPLTYIAGQVAVFADTPNYTFLDDIATLTLELGATLEEHNGSGAFDTQSLFIDADTGGQIATRQTTLMFDVNPGDTFYIWQTLRTSAAYGTRSADAFSTMSGSFDRPDLVTSLSTPEPSAALLVLCGLTTALSRSTRHRR